MRICNALHRPALPEVAWKHLHRFTLAQWWLTAVEGAYRRGRQAPDAASRLGVHNYMLDYSASSVWMEMLLLTANYGGNHAKCPAVWA